MVCTAKVFLYVATLQCPTAKICLVYDIPWCAYFAAVFDVHFLALLLSSLFLDCSVLLCTKSWNSASSIRPFPSP